MLIRYEKETSSITFLVHFTKTITTVFIAGKKRRRYSGPTGWVLAYHVPESVWKITSPMSENTPIILSDDDILPVEVTDIIPR